MSEATVTLTEYEGFDAMRVFLEAYWRRGRGTSDDIAVLLGSLGPLREGEPADPAQWTDWQDAVRRVVKRDPAEKPE